MSAKQPAAAFHVVAAALIDAQGRVLIAQRPPGKHLAGGWEFPGGKLKPGEDRRAGLARELREELGVEILMPRPLMRLKHTYPYGEVLLDMWVVHQFSGAVSGLDNQALRWCTQDELRGIDMLPADAPLVAALRLPEQLTEESTEHYSIGEMGLLDPRARLRGVYCGGLADALAASDGGANFVVLTHELPHADIASICELVPIPVYVPRLPLADAWALGATGITGLRLADSRQKSV